MVRNGEPTSLYLNNQAARKLNEIINAEGFRSRSECVTHLIQSYNSHERQVGIDAIQEQLLELKEILLNVSISAGSSDNQSNIERAISIVDDIWE